MARGLVLTPAIAVAGLVMAGSTASPAAATVARDSQPGGPILECSYHDSVTGKYNTLWGYSNQTGQTYVVPVGTYNTFSNPAANAGQPTTFLSGTHDNVFIVTHTGSSSWTLGTVTLTAPGKACATNPVPFLPSDVPAWAAIGGLMAAILAGGLFVQRRVAQASAH